MDPKGLLHLSHASATGHYFEPADSVHIHSIY